MDIFSDEEGLFFKFYSDYGNFTMSYETVKVNYQDKEFFLDHFNNDKDIYITRRKTNNQYEMVNKTIRDFTFLEWKFQIKDNYLIIKHPSFSHLSFYHIINNKNKNYNQYGYIDNLKNIKIFIYAKLVQKLKRVCNKHFTKIYKNNNRIYYFNHKELNFICYNKNYAIKLYYKAIDNLFTLHKYVVNNKILDKKEEFDLTKSEHIKHGRSWFRGFYTNTSYPLPQINVLMWRVLYENLNTCLIDNFLVKVIPILIREYNENNNHKISENTFNTLFE
jgi:hypothetical protein